MLEKLSAPRNSLLLELERSELGDICFELQRADLVPFEPLFSTDSPLFGIWFPESGFVSALVSDSRGVKTEIAMVGREGAIGRLDSHSFLGMDVEFVAQHRGVAHFIAADRVEEVIDRVPALSDILAKAQTAFLCQVARTAHSNARGRVAQRSARWLLMAHDRVDNDVIFVTHEILASMLGVRRVGVTNALHVLEGERLIRADRGRIRVIDRSGLIAFTEHLYVPSASESEQRVAPSGR